MVGNVETGCRMVRWSHNLRWFGLSDSRLRGPYRRSTELAAPRIDRFNRGSLALLSAAVRSRNQEGGVFRFRLSIERSANRSRLDSSRIERTSIVSFDLRFNACTHIVVNDRLRLIGDRSTVVRISLYSLRVRFRHLDRDNLESP